MSIKATCPQCHNSFHFPESAGGKRVRCFKCMTSMLVPGSPAEEEIPSVEEAGGGEEIEEVEEVRRPARRGPRRRLDEPEGLSATTMTLIAIGALAALLVVFGGFLLWSHLGAIEAANQLAAQANNGPQIVIGPNGIRMPGDIPIVPQEPPPVPVPPAAKPLVPPADVPEAVQRLKTEQGARRQAALDWLAAQPVDPNQQAEVAQALAALLRDKNAQVREQAFKILELWATAETVPALVGLLDDRSFFSARDRVMDLLAGIKDGKGLPALAARLTKLSDRNKAAQALKKAGSAAESAVLPYLADNNDFFTRQAAVDVLAAIGTAASVPALTRLAESERGLKFKAQGAAQQIGRRK